MGPVALFVRAAASHSWHGSGSANCSNLQPQRKNDELGDNVVTKCHASMALLFFHIRTGKKVKGGQKLERMNLVGSGSRKLLTDQ